MPDALNVPRKPDNRRFQGGGFGHHGAGAYRCDDCGKLTRETGEGESSLHMCAFCYLRSGLRNSLLDGVINQEEFDRALADLRRKYRRSDG